MKLVSFRVQNYKKVDDTGWIPCDNLTAFVGKNEAGKSAVFKGLSKLNPSEGQKYDGLREFPRRRYTSEFSKKDWPASSVKFQLEGDEVKELTSISPLLKGSQFVECTRYYSWRLEVRFDNVTEPTETIAAYLSLLRTWHSVIKESVAPDGKGELLETLKTSLLPMLTEKITILSKTDRSSPISAEQEKIVIEISGLLSGHFNEQWHTKLFKTIIKENADFKTYLEGHKPLSAAKEWVINNIPKFIYFDRYDIIESAVNIPIFIQQMSQDPSAPKVRTTKCLFQHVGLDVNELIKLDPNQTTVVEDMRRMADERAIKMSSASQAMTTKFEDWWEQRKHSFKYQVDGPSFRVWVSDDLDPSDIELDQRSAGMQYFFSFYLIFLVEAQGLHKDSILLLDEPGIHVHGTAQQKIVKFLGKLSKENQLLYTTHSPFMVDGDRLENVRVVYEDKTDGTTKISSDVWPPDKDSLFPVQAALGYAIAQTLFFSKRQLVVEGITDYWVLKAMNDILQMKAKNHLRKDAVILPSGGVNKLMPLVSLLLGHEIKVAVLLDGDEPGIRKGKELESKLLLQCEFISTFADTEGAELEDMFPQEFYLEAVKEAYPEISLEFNEEEKLIKPITKRVEAAFNRIGASFEKWPPARIIVDRLLKDPEALPKSTLEQFDTLFARVNSILDQPSPS